MPNSLDDLDRRILRELQDDASQSLDEIARKVGSSKTPVWNRVRKLRAAGVITRQTVLLDPKHWGWRPVFSFWCAPQPMKPIGSNGSCTLFARARK